MARKRNIDFMSQLDPRVRRWLNTPDPDQDDEDDDSDDHYDRWLQKRKSAGQIMEVGGVLVDRILLSSRFACLPWRCSPAVDRGAYRSCCADLTVYLTPAERARLGKHRNVLADHLRRREPRLKRIIGKTGGRIPRFFLDEDGDAFCRPGDRCVFSHIDSQGRIRCHLHPVHRKLGVDQTDLQPITCRLFPLVLCHMPHRKALVTLNNRDNYRAWGGKHPRYFPCLSEPDLPPVLRTMGPTLDWLFGKGFTSAIKRAGRMKSQRPS